MPMAMMSPPYSLLSSASRSQPSSLSLSLINQYSFHSLCSLVSQSSLLTRLSLKIFLFYFETNKILYIKIFPNSTEPNPRCWLLLPPPHTTPNTATSLSFHHGSSQPLSLGFLLLDQVNFLPFSSLFFCILWYGFIILFKWFFFFLLISNKNHINHEEKLKTATETITKLSTSISILITLSMCEDKYL